MWRVIGSALAEARRAVRGLRADAAESRRVAVVGGQQVHGLPKDYVARAKPIFDDHAALDVSGIVWQPDVYELAITLARLANCTTVVDLGCGFAQKLALAHPEFAIVGMDIPSNVIRCRNQYPFGTWIECDFEEGISDLGPDTLGNAVVICSDVIEHIMNVDRFATDLAKIIRFARVAIITTPERTLTRGRFHRGPPPNPCHLREWNAREFKQFLRAHGIEGWFGLTRSEDRSGDMKTIIVVATRGPASSG